jgi:hypothetical protein
MPIFTVCGRASIMLVVSWSLPLVAQSSNYHMEFVDIAPGITQIVLVNDSSQPIEAFHVLEQCDAGDGWWGRDALSGAGGPRSTSSDIQWSTWKILADNWGRARRKVGWKSSRQEQRP